MASVFAGRHAPVAHRIEQVSGILAELPADRDKRITVHTAAVDGELVLSIIDSGHGIAPENLGRIFEPLFSTKNFGTGLGLPTVRQIVNQHGGVIAVDSEVGKGTRVTVRLPIESVARHDIRVAA